MPPGKELHIFFGNLTFVDHACLDQPNAFKSLYEEAGGELIVEWDELVHHHRTSGRIVPEGKMASEG